MAWTTSDVVDFGITLLMSFVVVGFPIWAYFILNQDLDSEYF